MSETRQFTSDIKRIEKIEAALADLLYFAKHSDDQVNKQDDLTAVMVRKGEHWLFYTRHDYSKEAAEELEQYAEKMKIPPDLVVFVRDIFSKKQLYASKFGNVLIEFRTNLRSYNYYYVDVQNDRVISIPSSIHDKNYSSLYDMGCRNSDNLNSDAKMTRLSSRDARIAAEAAQVPYVNYKLAQKALDELDSLYSSKTKLGDLFKGLGEIIAMVVETLGLRKANPKRSEVNINLSSHGIGHRLFQAVESKQLDQQKESHDSAPSSSPTKPK